eukprot:scaffold17030_cov86-Skeletonema_marinoi.AAC.3
MSCIILSRLALWTLGCIHNVLMPDVDVRGELLKSSLLTNPSLQYSFSACVMSHHGRGWQH